MQSNEELEKIQTQTLSHYDDNAESFWSGTREHDVSQNIDALISALPSNRALDILDFGCGPGRDLLTFKSKGHRPVGLDGSRQFCEMANKYSGCEVLNQSFLDLNLEDNKFDGVFANASLFHIPSQELVRVLKQLNRCLRPGGILFSSNPRGDEEGWNGPRYAHYMELEVMTDFLSKAGFKVVQHYYRPQGQPCHMQPWLAIVSQKESE